MIAAYQRRRTTPSHAHSAVQYHPASDLQEMSDALVMCDFTPIRPNYFPQDRSGSALSARLFLLYEPHAPVDVWRKSPDNLKQRITEWYYDDVTKHKYEQSRQSKLVPIYVGG